MKIPDLEKVRELARAIKTHCYDSESREWADEILAELGENDDWLTRLQQEAQGQHSFLWTCSQCGRQVPINQHECSCKFENLDQHE